MDFRIGMIQGTLEVLDETLAALHPRIRSFNNPTGRNRNKSRFTCRCFLGFRQFGRKLEANLGHDLGIEQFQRHLDRVGMVAVVEQDCDFGKVDWLLAKIVQVINQHLNQALIISDIGSGTVREEWQSQRIDRQMPLDPIGAFVMTKSFGFKAGIAGIFHGLRVND